MLIGGDDISNNVITLGTCFSVFVRHSQAKGFISLIGAYTTGIEKALRNKL